MKIKDLVFNKILALIMSLAISIAILSIVVAPKYNELRAIKLEVELKENNLQSKMDLIDKVKNYNEVNKNLEGEDLDKIYDILPDDGNFENYIAIIEHNARGILIDDYSVEESRNGEKAAPGSSKNDVVVAKGSFSATGSLSNFIYFLKNIEKSIPVIDIESISVSKADTGSQEEKLNNKHSVLNYDVKFVFYHR